MVVARRRARPIWVTAAVVVTLFVALSAKLFVWPASNPVQGARADAVLVLNGAGPRLPLAMRLAEERAAPVMLVSVASVQFNCPHFGVPGVRVECFRPNPFTTQGEARYAGRQARLHSWHSLIVVSSVPQSTRARLRVQRCFRGRTQVVVATPSTLRWAYDIVYEWGALAKALVWQRSC